MTRALRHTTKPPIVIIIAGETNHLNEVVESVYQLAQGVMRLIELITVLVSLLVAIVEPVVICLEAMAIGYKTIDTWLINQFRSLIFVPVYRGIG